MDEPYEAPMAEPRSAPTLTTKLAPTMLGCVVGGTLVSLAYHVQGGAPLAMLPYGCGVGAAIGYGVASGWIRPPFAAASAGAVVALTFFQCLPCDGSNVMMPALGALAGWGASVVATLANRTTPSRGS